MKHSWNSMNLLNNEIKSSSFSKLHFYIYFANNQFASNIQYLISLRPRQYKVCLKHMNDSASLYIIYNWNKLHVHIALRSFQ